MNFEEFIHIAALNPILDSLLLVKDKSAHLRRQQGSNKVYIG